MSTPIGFASVSNLTILSFEAICFAGHARATFARTHGLDVGGVGDEPSWSHFKLKMMMKRMRERAKKGKCDIR